ncbi:MAG: DUF2800 domain-containing protein [Verrucomicrobiales bacterium]|nr:DUF2800 domain-containing protein [Verrucomicrobiales bacterium]
MSALRPSNLPKLAVCPCYESNPVAGAAAERGTLLDGAFRAELLGEESRRELAEKLTPDENAAVSCAVSVVRAMAGRERVLAREDDCRLRMLGLTGTADALLPSRQTLFDLKTGARRNYREQMAAYALAMIEAQFAASWTCHLLFCDQREVETIRFAYDEALETVEGVITAHRDPEKRPRPCEYCSWCAKAETCEARRALAAQALPAAEPGFDFEAVVSDPEKLGRFLTACGVVEDFHDRAKKVAAERIKAGGEVPGWRVVNRKGAEFIDCETVGHHIGALGFGPVLAAYGNLSAAKFRQLWEQRMPSEKPFPVEAVKHAAPISYLKQTKTKN